MSAPPYFPLSGGTYRPQMGLSPLDLDAWIERDAHAASELALKAKLLVQRRDEVLQFTSDADDPCQELHAMLRDHLLRRFPDSYQSHQNGSFTVVATGRNFAPPTSGEDALAQAAQWVQEDLCFLAPSPPTTLAAGCVCFPSRWSLKEKIGKTADAIHAPVPKYKETIAKPTAGFLDRITADKPVWRLNWTVHDSDHLFCPAGEEPRRDITEANVLEETFLRVERQTLRRLPRTGAVIFTIRTYQTPMRDVIADPGRKAILAATLDGLPEDSARYKGMQFILPALKAALER